MNVFVAGASCAIGRPLIAQVHTGLDMFAETKDYGSFGELSKEPKR
jgi:hypothetical protein